MIRYLRTYVVFVEVRYLKGAQPASLPEARRMAEGLEDDPGGRTCAILRAHVTATTADEAEQLVLEKIPTIKVPIYCPGEAHQPVVVSANVLSVKHQSEIAEETAVDFIVAATPGQPPLVRAGEYAP